MGGGRGHKFTFWKARRVQSTPQAAAPSSMRDICLEPDLPRQAGDLFGVITCPLDKKGDARRHATLPNQSFGSARPPPSCQRHACKMAGRALRTHPEVQALSSAATPRPPKPCTPRCTRGAQGVYARHPPLKPPNSAHVQPRQSPRRFHRKPLSALR